MEEKPVIRVMPNSLEAEQSLIGSMFIDKEAIVTAAGILTADDFYHRSYALIYETIQEMYDKGKDLDIVTLQENLKIKNAPEEIYSVKFLKDIAMAVPTAANARQYAEIIKDKSLLRDIIRVNEEIAGECYSQDRPTEDILADTETKIFRLVQKKGAGGTVMIKEVLRESIDKISEAYANKGEISGVATGFVDLDYCLSGLQPSDLILIAARPSMGKTAFVLNIAAHAALKGNITTAIFSLEMSAVQLANRLLSIDSGVDSEKMRKGDLNTMDWERIVDSADTLASAGLIIDDAPGISVAELRSRCRKYKAENNLGLVIIDYLQLMSSSSKREDSRQQEISEISRSLKALARELDVPVVTLSQLSRAPEARQDHRPMLSDLRESGAIEQDADVVMFIYRDEYYNEDSEEKGVAEINVAKQRNGPVKTIKLAWLPEQTRFANLDLKRKNNG